MMMLMMMLMSLYDSVWFTLWFVYDCRWWSLRWQQMSHPLWAQRQKLLRTYVLAMRCFEISSGVTNYDLIPYLYSSCFCCSRSCWGNARQESKSDLDEVWQNCSSSKYASIDLVGLDAISYFQDAGHDVISRSKVQPFRSPGFYEKNWIFPLPSSACGDNDDDDLCVWFNSMSTQLPNMHVGVKQEEDGLQSVRWRVSEDDTTNLWRYVCKEK